MATKIDSTSWTGINPLETPEPLDPRELRPVSKYYRSGAGQAGLVAATLLFVILFVYVVAVVVTLFRVLDGDSSAADWIRGPEWDRKLTLFLAPLILPVIPLVIWWQGRQLSRGAAGKPVLRLDQEGFEDSRYGLGFLPWRCVTRVAKVDERSVWLELGGPLPDGRDSAGLGPVTIDTWALSISRDRLPREIVTRWLLARGELTSPSRR